MHHRSQSARSLHPNPTSKSSSNSNGHHRGQRKQQKQRPQTAVERGEVIFDPFQSIRTELRRQSQFVENRMSSRSSNRYSELQRATSLQRLSRIDLNAVGVGFRGRERASPPSSSSSSSSPSSRSIAIHRDDRHRENVVVPVLPLSVSASSMSIPNRNSGRFMASNSEFESTSNRCLSRWGSSLSLHSRLQNEASSHCLGLLSSRYFGRDYDSNSISERTSMPLAMSQSLSTTKSQMELHFERIDEILSSHRPQKRNQNENEKQRLNRSQRDSAKKRVRPQTANTGKVTKRRRSVDTSTKSIESALDRKLESIRSDSSQRRQFQESVEQIRRHRHRRMAATNYLTSNRLSAAIHSKTTALKSAQKLNRKWRCNRERIQWRRKQEEQEQREREWNRANRKETALRIPKRRKLRNAPTASKENEYRLRFWASTLCTVQRVEAVLSLLERMEQIESLRRRERESGRVIVRFYRKYVVSKRRYNTKEMVKALQRSLRSYALKHRALRTQQSSKQLLLFLMQFDKTQGLIDWTQSVDVDGRVRKIQKMWNRHRKMNHCRRVLMERHLMHSLNMKVDDDLNPDDEVNDDEPYSRMAIRSAIRQIHALKLKEHNLALRRWIRANADNSVTKQNDDKNRQIIGFKPQNHKKPVFRALLSAKEKKQCIRTLDALKLTATPTVNK